MLEEILHKGLKIDKRHWKPVRFGDVVMEPKETAKNLAKEGIEHVVGLDHIDSEDIHLRRSAGIEEATTFTKKFRKGDVLFGRRRAYLKKAAVAPFTGICSGDITVFRAKEGLLPALLPFLVNNEKFFDYAMKHSAGGLSPRVKFKDLANFEFLLPTIEQQTALAELLWALDEVIIMELKVLENIQRCFLSVRENSITNSEFSKLEISFAVKKIITYGIVQPGPNIENGIPYIQSSDIKNGSISKLLSKTSIEIAKAYARSEVEEGDILFSLRGNLGDVAILSADLGTVNIARGVARISLKNIHDNLYFKYALQTTPVRSKIHSVSQGSTFKEVSLEILRKIKIPIPSDLNVQREIAIKLKGIEQIEKKQIERINKSKLLFKNIIGTII